MAQRTIIELTDDLDESVAHETVHFGLDGVSYEIDLSAANATRLRDSLAEFVEGARKVRKDGGAVKQRRVQVATGLTGREQNKAARDWARVTFPDRNVSDRGRLPKDLVEKYLAAHRGGVTPIDPTKIGHVTLAEDLPEATEPERWDEVFPATTNA